MNRTLCYALVLMLLTACGAQRNLVYFSDLENSAEYKIPSQTATDPKIQANDLLDITVSSLSAESNNLFNGGAQPTVSRNVATEQTSALKEGYLVDKNGFINFLVIGKVKLGGLSREEATEKLTGIIAEAYTKNPIVNVRFLNFKITVIGEVNRPSTFLTSSERINVLEALGLAGDMTGFGKRENVLVIREKEGTRNMTRINLNSKDVLNSPYFYLQQNDIVYVEPDKARAVQVNRRTINLPIYLSVASIIAIVATRLLY